jgi:hypothetical protein
MNRSAMLVFCLLGLGGLISCRGAQKSIDDLSAVQIMSFQESENRLLIDRQAMDSLQNDLEYHRVSHRIFAARYQQISTLIADEVGLQNCITTKSKAYTGKTDAVLRTMAKLAVQIPLTIATAILTGGGNFSP